MCVIVFIKYKTVESFSAAECFRWRLNHFNCYSNTTFSPADQRDRNLLCQLATHDCKPKLQQIFFLCHPNGEEMLIFGKEIFLDHVLKLLHHWGGWGKLPVVTSSPGVAVLGKRLESKEFPPGEHPLLCERKLNYVIMGPSYFVHDLNIHLCFAEVQSLSYFISLFTAVPEPKWTCTKQATTSRLKNEDNMGAKIYKSLNGHLRLGPKVS